MKKIFSTIKSFATYTLAVSFATGILLTAQSCSEKLDDGDFAIAKEQTIADFLATNSEFSDICKLMQTVSLGSKEDASSVFAALSARGNYTVFAPNNDALKQYVTNLLGENKSIADLSEEEAQLVVYSCIIDNGDDGAYESAQFPLNGGTFPKTDLNDRQIECIEVEDADNTLQPTYFLIGDNCKVVDKDNKLSNGYVHELGGVIAPSNDFVPELIKSAGNMQVMGALLHYTGWDEKLTSHIDLSYEKADREFTHTATRGTIKGRKFSVPEHRFLGYTGLIETDDVFAQHGIVPQGFNLDEGGTVSNWDEMLPKIKAIAENAYGEDTTGGDLHNEDNPINRFVAYHFIEGKLAYNKFVNHCNEFGYAPLDWTEFSTDYSNSIDIADYFVTVGSHRSTIKIMQEAKGENDIFANRTCTYDVNGNYTQSGVVNHGVKISAENIDPASRIKYKNNAKNGFYFPIDGILALDKTTSKALGSERMRFDVSTILPELLNTGCRGLKYEYFDDNNFFDGITGCSDDTELKYLSSVAIQAEGWGDMEGDEFMVLGVYDFVLRLPPVPADGYYEFRMAMNNNQWRGMCQVYFGDSPDNLVPVGLPLDLRLNGTNENVGWVADVEGNAARNAEIDKNMRNHGYMKAPYSIHNVSKSLPESDNAILRNRASTFRRILTTQELKADKTYYVRFKSCLEDPGTEFVMDYFEFVPRSIYNGTEPEDKW